jgi:hypothetical protein
MQRRRLIDAPVDLSEIFDRVVWFIGGALAIASFIGWATS